MEQHEIPFSLFTELTAASKFRESSPPHHGGSAINNKRFYIHVLAHLTLRKLASLHTQNYCSAGRNIYIQL
jgi:hypothetical protein